MIVYVVTAIAVGFLFAVGCLTVEHLARRGVK